MAIKIVNALFLGGYKIEIKFSDDKIEVVDFEEYIRYTPAFEVLKHPAVFRNFTINSSGSLVWGNSAIKLSAETLLNRPKEPTSDHPRRVNSSGLAPLDHGHSYQPV